MTLALSGITLSPAFSPETTAYTGEVEEALETTTVSAMAAHSGATIEGAGEMPLMVGENTVEVMVTADDGTTTMTYTVMVTVTVPSSDASLTSLSLMDGMGMDITLVAGVEAHWNTLDCPAMNDRVGADDEPDDMTSPYCRMYDGLDDAAKMVVDAKYAEDPIEGFMSDIDMYYASVASDVEMVTVNAMAMPGATVSGDVGAVSLDVGENTITVTVTAEDGTTTMTYTVTVTVTVPSSDASLTSLSLMDGMGMDITLVAGVEAHWNTLDCPAMNDRVGADDEPDDMTSPYCRMYDGLDDAAKMVVDATYDEDPIEGFMSDIDMYYASVASDVDMVTVSAMAMPGATVSGDVGAVSLDVGGNTITVTVTAEDGTTMMTYRVMVTVLSSDATLESLTLSDITLSPPFDPATMEYTATVAYVESTTVEATPTHSGAMVDGTGEMSLAVGENADQRDGNGRRRHYRNLHRNGHRRGEDST